MVAGVGTGARVRGGARRGEGAILPGGLHPHNLWAAGRPLAPGHTKPATIAPMKTLVFAGSTRTHSYNRRLAHVAADLARAAGADVTHLELADFDIPLYNAELEARGTPADVLRLKEAMDSHPAWIVCSPEYNGSYTGLLKNTLDWASSPVAGHPVWHDGNKPFGGKVVGLLSASPGALGGLGSLNHLAPMLSNLQCWVCPTRFALGHAGQAFDEHGQLVHDSARSRVQAVVAQTLWAARRLAA